MTILYLSRNAMIADERAFKETKRKLEENDDVKIDLTTIDSTKISEDGSSNEGSTGGMKLMPTFSARSSSMNITSRRRGTSISLYNKLRQNSPDSKKEPESFAESIKMSWKNM